jgi:peptide methionine sulfoxide reductase msrA/msrB
MGGMMQTPLSAPLQPATFAGGCFWCLQGPYEATPGVSQVEVGYAGGDAASASYYKVANGGTKHRESIHMLYDPAVVSYEKLLEIFWRNIDPIDPGGQFADRGHQYTTAISYHSEDQRRLAEASKQILADSGKFIDPIATVIEPFVSFFPAEEEHQQYYKKRPLQYQMYKRGSGRADYLAQKL